MSKSKTARICKSWNQYDQFLYSFFKTLTMDHIWWPTVPTFPSLWLKISSKQNLHIKFNMSNAIQLVCWFNSLICLPLNIKLIMLLIILKESKIKSIQNYFKAMRTHLATIPNFQMSKSLRVMITPDSIGMSLSILLLDLILWDFYKNKW